MKPGSGFHSNISKIAGAWLHPLRHRTQRKAVRRGLRILPQETLCDCLCDHWVRRAPFRRCTERASARTEIVQKNRGCRTRRQLGQDLRLTASGTSRNIELSPTPTARQVGLKLNLRGGGLNTIPHRPQSSPLSSILEPHRSTNDGLGTRPWTESIRARPLICWRILRELRAV
jgi:hypothetical protein